MNHQTHTDRVTGIELIERTGHYAYEQDDGEMAFGPINARTLFFDAISDAEALSAHRCAAPGGIEATREVGFIRTLQRDVG